MVKKEDEIYKEGIRQQKMIGWFFVIFGVIFTLTFFGAIIGIPMILIGIGFILSKNVNHIIANSLRDTIKQPKAK